MACVKSNAARNSEISFRNFSVLRASSASSCSVRGRHGLRLPPTGLGLVVVCLLYTSPSPRDSTSS
eukprot:10862396-Prorocentrum_lima.AAC.1